jgi:hypothetical protein
MRATREDESELLEALVASGLPQFFANSGDGIPNFIDCSLQFISAYTKVLGPIFHI